MQIELPGFEGRDVQASIVNFSGKVAQRVGALAEGESVIVIAKVRVGAVTHTDRKIVGGRNSPRMFTRVHESVATRAIVLSEEDGSRLLEEAINLADEKFGIESLFSEVTKDTGATDDGGD